MYANIYPFQKRDEINVLKKIKLKMNLNVIMSLPQ